MLAVYVGKSIPNYDHNVKYNIRIRLEKDNSVIIEKPNPLYYDSMIQFGKDWKVLLF